MTLVLASLGVITLLEMLLWLPIAWRGRRLTAAILILPLAITSGLLAGLHPAVWTALLVFFSAYRLINLLRVVENRPHGEYLAASVRTCSRFLIVCQLLVLGLAAWQYHVDISSLWWLYTLVATQYGCLFILLSSTVRHVRTTRPYPLRDGYADRDLPTLTVAIPARNETDDLDACLQTLTASDYPKLEILVLDDCSQEKRTPEIIRAFAHDGVRFLAGDVPPERWLAKNYAYMQLAEAANGELLLFCGVDVRFQPQTLRNLVIALLQKKKRMMSIVPRNEVPKQLSLDALLLQPGRYAWEMALPRRLLRRPPVLSTCWILYHNLLDDAGGFGAVSRSITPESYFAKWAATHQDGYSFLQSDASIGLTCLKSSAEQRATAVRTRYPQLHRRPELVGLLGLLELSWLFLPFVVCIAAVVVHSWLLAVLCGFNSLLLLTFYALIVRFTYRRWLIIGCLLLPLAALYDLLTLNNSMWQYEFSEVIWKDRNVCIPVMHVVPSLPKS